MVKSKFKSKDIITKKAEDNATANFHNTQMRTTLSDIMIEEIAKETVRSKMQNVDIHGSTPIPDWIFRSADEQVKEFFDWLQLQVTNHDE